nr:MAG TPA: hypothetical protein [Caudoviricetes sp.]
MPVTGCTTPLIHKTAKTTVPMTSKANNGHTHRRLVTTLAHTIPPHPLANFNPQQREGIQTYG